VVAVAYERWSLITGYKYGDLTWKLLVIWKTDRRGEVVAYEGCSQPEGSQRLFQANVLFPDA